MLSLSVMTLVSVGIGLTFSRVPEFMKSSLPIGEWAGAALLVYFGLRTLRVPTCLPVPPFWNSQCVKQGRSLMQPGLSTTHQGPCA